MNITSVFEMGILVILSYMVSMTASSPISHPESNSAVDVDESDIWRLHLGDSDLIIGPTADDALNNPMTSLRQSAAVQNTSPESGRRSNLMSVLDIYDEDDGEDDGDEGIFDEVEIAKRNTDTQSQAGATSQCNSTFNANISSFGTTPVTGDADTRMPSTTIGGPCMAFPEDSYECPGILPVYGDGYNLLSTCPWKYINNYDPKREPMLIKNVTCLCETCRSIDVTPEGEFLAQEMMMSTCAAIHFDVAVLRWDDYTRSGPATPGTERVNVGCTCLRTNYRR